MSNEQGSGLSFGNLPLIEVALRASFSQPLELTYNLVNSIHAVIRAEFPVLSEPAQFESAPGEPSAFELGPGKLPGALFGGSQGITISLQNQVVVVRWQKTKLTEYPRYPALRSALETFLGELRRYHSLAADVAGVDPIVSTINMSYVNFIRALHTDPVLKRYFSKEAHMGCAVDQPTLHQIEASWRTKEAQDFRFRLQAVSAAMGDARLTGYRLTTAAGRQIPCSDSTLAEMDDLHVRLQGFFLNLISEEAKNEWQLGD